MEIGVAILDALIQRLEESDKAYSDVVPRDQIMQTQTDIFFNLGLRHRETMEDAIVEYRASLGSFKADIVKLISDYQTGILNREETLLQWKALTGRYYVDLFQLGTKSMDNPYYQEQGLTSKDMAFISKARRFEETYFQKFLMDIDAAKRGDFQPTMDFNKRAEAYAESGKAQFYNGMVAGAGTGVEIHWVDMGGEEECSQCRILASKIWTWETLPTTPGAGDTDCLFNCRCRLDIRASRGVAQVPAVQIPGAASLMPSNQPGQYATVLDAQGNEMTGQILQDAEDLYSEMYKARQMIMVTDGQEKMDWVATRKELTQALIDRMEAGGFKALPTVSVTTLESVVKFATEQAPGGIIRTLSEVRNGMEVVFVRAGYWTRGIVELKGSQPYVKTAKGDEYQFDNTTDLLFSIAPIEVPTVEKLGLNPDEILRNRQELEDLKDQIVEGGPGSGNFQHAGRPGEVGGSGEGGVSLKDVESKLKELGPTGGWGRSLMWKVDDKGNKVLDDLGRPILVPGPEPHVFPSDAAYHFGAEKPEDRTGFRELGLTPEEEHLCHEYYRDAAPVGKVGEAVEKAVQNSKPSLRDCEMWRGLHLDEEKFGVLENHLRNGEMAQIKMHRPQSWTDNKSTAWDFAKPTGYHVSAGTKSVMLRVLAPAGTKGCGGAFGMGVGRETWMSKNTVVDLVGIRGYRDGYILTGVLHGKG